MLFSISISKNTVYLLLILDMEDWFCQLCVEVRCDVDVFLHTCEGYRRRRGCLCLGLHNQRPHKMRTSANFEPFCLVQKY